MIKVPDVGALLHLNVLFGPTPKVTAFTLQLITDANALADTDINTTHTVAAGGGYTDKVLSNNPVIALNNGIAEAVWPVQTWTFTGALTGNATITGYQILAGTTLLHEENLTNFTPSRNGDQIEFTPRMRLGNGVPA